MRLATTANLSLSMAGKRIGIVKLLQSRSDGAIRQPGGSGDGGDAAAAQGTCFDRGPATPAPLVQVIEELNELVTDSFKDSSVMHDQIMAPPS